MSNNYEFVLCNCDLCDTDHRPAHAQARAEFPHLFVEGKPGILRDGADSKAYIKRYQELRAASWVKCFYFRVECGGDSIAICKKCFLKIAEECDSQGDTSIVTEPNNRK